MKKSEYGRVMKVVAQVAVQFKAAEAVRAMDAYRPSPVLDQDGGGVSLPATSPEQMAYDAGRIAGVAEFLMEVDRVVKRAGFEEE